VDHGEGEHIDERDPNRQWNKLSHKQLVEETYPNPCEGSGDHALPPDITGERRGASSRGECGGGRQRSWGELSKERGGGDAMRCDCREGIGPEPPTPSRQRGAVRCGRTAIRLSREQCQTAASGRLGVGRALVQGGRRTSRFVRSRPEPDGPRTDARERLAACRLRGRWIP
jgi:hypothetical protein